MVFTYKLSVSYDGTNFYGYQKQEKHRSVQEELEKAITRLNANKPIVLLASGRTDRKVHAINQVCSFQCDSELNLYYFKHALNTLLPNDINVSDVELVDNNFHPRYDAKSKTYRYLINVGPYDVFKANYVYQFNRELDLDAMIEASKVFIGKHDFRTFSSALKSQDTIREIFDIKITKENKIIAVEFNGDGFLRYMVRKIVTAILDVGLHKKSVDDLNKLLEEKNKTKYSKVISGEGLYLVDVKY